MLGKSDEELSIFRAHEEALQWNGFQVFSAGTSTRTCANKFLFPTTVLLFKLDKGNPL